MQALAKDDIAYEAKKMIDKDLTVNADGKTSYRTKKDIRKLFTATIAKDKTTVCKKFHKSYSY